MKRLCYFGLLGILCHLTQVALPASTPHEDPIYRQLFKDKDKWTHKRGALTVHRYDDKVYLEVPRHLLGREYLLSSVVESSSDYLFLGSVVAAERYLTIEQVDSMVVAKQISNNIYPNPDDPAQAKALRASNDGTIYKTFPIQGYTKDSLSLIFDTGDLFKYDSESVIELTGRSYVSMINIAGVKVDSDASFLEGVDAFDNAILVKNTTTAELSLNVMGFQVENTPTPSLSIGTYLLLLPEQRMEAREAHPAIGTGFVPFLDFRNAQDVKPSYFVTRRANIDAGVTFYVDTLFPAKWFAAVEAAAKEWNTAFQSIGIKAPIKVTHYPRDARFRPENPMINAITLNNYAGIGVNVYNVTDPRSGEIMGSKIAFSRDFTSLVRYLGMVKMAAVDKRFRDYHLSDEVVAEAVKAVALTAFGECLGLTANFAGSFAYSPDEVRSPSFTRHHGFTASVMDGAIYNCIAQPGDKEKGVVLVNDKLGEADRWALKYLYQEIPKEEERRTLRAWGKSAAGNPIQRYSAPMLTILNDPRAQQSDLSNDPFVALKYRINNLKYFMQHAHEWLLGDEIPQSFKSGIVGSIYSEFYNQALWPLFSFIGGIYMEDTSEGSAHPPFKPVPADLQRKAVQTILSACDDLSWLDTNKELLLYAGPNNRVSHWILSNGYPMFSLMSRLRTMTLSVQHGGSKAYTQRAYLEDLESYLFAEVRKGKSIPAHKWEMMGYYISGLIDCSPALKSMEKSARKSSRSITEANEVSNLIKHKYPTALYHHSQSVRTPQEVYFYQSEDLTADAYVMLKRAADLLRQAQKTKQGELIYQEMLNYHLNTISRVVK